MSALLGSAALVPSAMAIPLVWRDGPEAGQAFTGGAISVKAFNYDTGTLYNNLGAGNALGYGVGGSAANRNAGESDLNDPTKIFRSVLGPTDNATYGSGSSEDGWGILKIDNILAKASDGIDHSLFDNLGSFELTAIFYGVRDFYISQVTDGSGSAFAGQIINGYNMHVDFYMAPRNVVANNFNQTGGPGVRIGDDGYPTVTDGVKILSLLSTPGFINDDGTLGGRAAEFESNTASVGYAALDVIGGDDPETVAQFDTNAVGFRGTTAASGGLVNGKVKDTTDVWFSFTSLPGTNGWDVNSNDPMVANIAGASVPDTGSTLALMACALPLLAAVRRRRAAA